MARKADLRLQPTSAAKPARGSTMINRPVLLGASLMLGVAACGSPDPWPTRAEDLEAISDPRRMLPPGAAPFFITLSAAVHPSWHVRAGAGIARTGTEIEVVVDVPVVVLLRSDVEADFQIPAMRVRKTVTPDVPAVAWFMPKTAGVFPILVSTNLGRCDGVLAVKEGTTRGPR